MAIELMTATAVFNATCPATPTPLPLALALALAWTSRPLYCPRAAPAVEVAPTHNARTTQCHSRKVRPIYPSVRRWDRPQTDATLCGAASTTSRPSTATYPGPSHPSSPLPAHSATVEGIIPRFVPPTLAIALPAREPVRPNTGISITTMAILNSFVNDILPLLTAPRHWYFQQDQGHELLLPQSKGLSPGLSCLPQQPLPAHAPLLLSPSHVMPLTQVHTGISNKTTAILNSFVNDIFEREGSSPDCCSSHPRVGCLNHKAVALPACDATQTGALQHRYFQVNFRSTPFLRTFSGAGTK
ncbi:hypothetical protein EDB83DRAFT_2534963 [Lactarius deliciosus]|nr:hypothetical protein EDB83DRAFT_2534963 [Lactarius deliciosus]